MKRRTTQRPTTAQPDSAADATSASLLDVGSSGLVEPTALLDANYSLLDTTSARTTSTQPREPPPSTQLCEPPSGTPSEQLRSLRIDDGEDD